MFLIAIIILDLCISYSSMAGKVSITQNITGLIGNHDTQITCSFISEAGEQISSVEIFGKNKQQEFDDINKPIAIFIPDQPGKLHSSVNYLIGRVTFTNITTMSTNATMTFNELKCEDAKDYICKCSYVDSDSSPTYKKSTPTTISVKVISSKPDHISSIIVTSTTEMQGFTSSIYNTTLSSQKGDSFSIPSSIETVTKTHLPSNVNLPLVYNEEDNVMFTCTGNIGNPPGKLIWQKTFPQGKTRITYSNETTYIEEIPGTCSFKGTSHLTVKIYIEDIMAKIRCFEESQVNVSEMYLETEPFDVLFRVNHIDINKQPNLKQYDTKTDNITLSCKFKGIGNPQPTYEWFKEGNNNSILSNKSAYVIENVIRNNSGVYICEVYNIIDDIHYRKSNSVEINILVDDLQSSQESDWWNFVKEYKIPLICGVAGFIVLCAVIVCCICQKKTKNKARCSQKTKSVGITMNTEYATVIRKNNVTLGETGDSMLVLNDMDRNKDKSRNKQEDLGKTVDVTTSYQISEYAVPSDALQTGTINCQMGPGFTSFKDVKDI